MPIFNIDGEELYLKEPLVAKKQNITYEAIPLTQAIKHTNLKISSIALGKIFIEKNVYQERSRPSTKYKGKFKTYKVISDEYLAYGVNVFSSKGQTIPRFFKEVFGELCLGLGIDEILQEMGDKK